MHDTASQKNAQLYNEQFLKVLKQEKSSNAKEIADWKSFFLFINFLAYTLIQHQLIQ